MDGKQPSPPRTRRKVKYAPRSTPSRKPKPTATPKTEAGDEEDDRESAQAQAIFRRMSESIARRGSKAETKLKNAASVQVAFGPGDSSSPSLRTYGNNKGVKSGKGGGLASQVSDSEKNVLSLPSTGSEDQSDALMIDATQAATDAPAGKVNKEYQEPWDYQSTYYPTSLPLRKPNSGPPEILDEEEFGEAAASIEYHENSVNSAAELGLLDQSEQKRMLLLQLPALPMVKQSVSKKGKEKVGTVTTSEASTKGCNLEDLPGGYMGKMLIYKSGAVKLKLGETLYDVSPGSNCTFAQDVVAMNVAEKSCCVLGDIEKRAVVTPDISSFEI